MVNSWFKKKLYVTSFELQDKLKINVLKKYSIYEKKV